MSILRTIEKVTNSYDLNQMQYDALWDLLSDNPLLPSNVSNIKNKALRTSKQNVIGAINELLDSIKKIETNVKSFDTSFKLALGDMGGADSESWTALQQIDTNVLRAIVKIWEELGGDLSIEEIGSSVRDAIRKLNDKVNNHEERISTLENKMIVEQYVRETPSFNPDIPNILTMTQTPNDKHVILYVNGLEYDEGDEITVDRETKQITWINTENSGGFDLDYENDEFDVVYYVNK